MSLSEMSITDLRGTVRVLKCSVDRSLSLYLTPLHTQHLDRLTAVLRHEPQGFPSSASCSFCFNQGSYPPCGIVVCPVQVSPVSLSLRAPGT